MNLTIKEMRKKDVKKAIQAAIAGMHFDWYLDSPLLLRLYGRYFWYLELSRATQVIAAYDGEAFAGVLLAEIQGEPKKYRSFLSSCYLRFFEVLMRLCFRGGASSYEEANKEMLAHYQRNHAPDGEILFLAAVPEAQGKGAGSRLLLELQKRAKGKTLYLYTDNACTYQFYEHRGFLRAEQKDILLHLGKKQVNLQCFLYSKTL